MLTDAVCREKSNTLLQVLLEGAVVVLVPCSRHMMTFPS
jgi:hypothetical protein